MDGTKWYDAGRVTVTRQPYKTLPDNGFETPLPDCPSAAD